MVRPYLRFAADNCAGVERFRQRPAISSRCGERAAYADDPRAAAERFGNREMVVSGEFLRIVPDGYGSLDLRLKTSNPDEQLGIDVAQLAIEDAKRLRPGQRVTVSCQHMGAGGDELWVQDCAIQLAGDAALPPSAPSPDPRDQEE